MKSFRPLALSLCLSLLAGISPRLAAQSVMTNTQTIYLQSVQLADTVKYGIYATIGGAAGGSVVPQLYEFDTGGDGFYAAFGAGATAWGTNYASTHVPVSNSYDSGDLYQGVAVTAPITLYSATNNTYAPTPVVQTAPNILIGQSTSITNTKGKDNNWPLQGTETAPIQGSFWGDFGLSLKANTNGIMNAIAQLQYTNNIHSGFIVQLSGTPGNTNASIQVGLSTNDLASFPIQVKMSGGDSNSYFPHTTNSTYSGQILTTTLSVSNSALGVYTNTIGVTLDTGATPKLHDFDDDETALTNYFTGASITEGVQLQLTVNATNGIPISILNLTAGFNTNEIYIPIQFGNDFYINVGADIFYNYDVMYDLETGTLGLRAVPEANRAALMAGGVVALVALSGVRTLLGKRKRRGLKA